MAGEKEFIKNAARALPVKARVFQGGDEKPRVESQKARPGGTVIVVVPILLVISTFLFWYQTWFGRKLTDQEMQQYLTDTSVPHKTQHALSQLADRIARGDSRARRWYPQVLGLAAYRETQFRSMAAWVMGEDSKSEEFHSALRKLVADPEPLVRWNAALALARCGDAAGDSQLRLMLVPYALAAPGGGTINFRVKQGDSVNNGSVLARIRAGGRATCEVHSPIAGRVERRTVNDGAQVTSGQEIAILSPAEDQVWEALRALYVVGGTQDLQDVERFAEGTGTTSDRVRQQAVLTVKAIRRRAAISDR